MAKAGTAYVDVRGNFGPLRTGFRQTNREFGKGMSDMESRLKRGFSTAAKLAGVALGGAAIVGTKKSVDAAVDLGEQINKTKVVFRGAEREVLSFGETSSKALGISNRAALEAAGTFGNMLVPMGITRKEAAGMSVEMVQLAADMASFNNASPEETLHAIRSGLSGESEPLRRFGVDLREAALQEFALSKGIKESVKEMTNAEKAQLAYRKIISDTGDAQGDFARTSDSLANKQRQLKAQLEDIGASLGTALLPALQKGAGALSDFADDVSKILNRKDLTTGEKFDRIGDEIAGRLEAAAPVIADAAARIGPKVATAFLKGFLNSPALVQLLAGVWVLAKGRKLLAAFGLLGAQSGAAFGAGVGTGAAGGAAGGAAAGGMAGLAAKLKPLVKKAGFIGLGLVAADTILEGLGARLDKASPELDKKLKGMVDQENLRKKVANIGTLGIGSIDLPVVGKLSNLVSTDEGKRATRLKEILDQIKNSRQGITAETAKEATQLAHNLNLTRQTRTEIQKVLDAGRNKASAKVFDIASAEAEVEKLGRLTPNLINQLSTQLEDLPRKTRPKFAQAVLDWATELKRDGKIKGNLQSLKNVIEGEVDGVGSLSIKGPRRLKTRLAAGFESMVAAVADPTSRMAGIVATYLEAFGASGIDKISGAIAKDKASRAKGHRGGLARGGFLGGQGRKDTIPIMAAPGEAVLNRHQQQPVEQALRQTYGYGLGDLFKREQRPHYFAKGGFAGKQSIVPIPGQPGESIHSSILKDVLALIARYKLRVTDGFAPSGHAAGGEHPKGLAIDAVPGAGGSWDLVDKLAKWAEPSQGAPRAPFRWVGYTGDSGHGRGDHLHLSWGGGGKGVDIAAPKLPGIKITGRSGVTKDLAKAATSQVRKAAQSFMDDQAGAAAPVGTSSDPGGGGGGSPTANRKLGRQMMRRIWPDSQWRALSTLWQGESGWKTTADNPDSSAYGIPQSLPGSKMASAGRDWRNNPATQIKWGLRYIKQRYGSPSAALSAWKGRSPHWYSEGGLVDSLQQMYAGGFVQPKAQAAKKKDTGGTKPPKLKKPPKGKGVLGKLSPAMDKWVKGQKKKLRKPDGGFQLKQLDALNTTLDRTISTIQERVQEMSERFGLTDEEHYPDERAVPRLQREGHNVQKIGDSFIDWTAVGQSKSELSQMLGESFKLIGTPFGASKGVMEFAKEAIPTLDASVTGIVKRLTDEVNEIRQQVRQNLREIRENEKEIDQLDEKLSKERGRKKPDKDKLKRWNREKDDRQDTVNDLRRQNRRLTGESAPSGDLSGVTEGRLGTVSKRRDDAKEALADLKETRDEFVGVSGVAGVFASERNDIQRLVNDLGALTTERISEAITPSKDETTSKLKEDTRAYMAALVSLSRDFKDNFRSLPSFAKGGISRLGLALVGEQGYELAKAPGRMPAIVGQQGPEIRELPVGTRVFSHPETKRKLAPLFQKVTQKVSRVFSGSEPKLATLKQATPPRLLRARGDDGQPAQHGTGELPWSGLVPTFRRGENLHVGSLRAPKPHSAYTAALGSLRESGHAATLPTLSLAKGGIVAPETKRMAKQMGIPALAQGGVIRPAQAQSSDADLTRALERIEALMKQPEGPQPSRSQKVVLNEYHGDVTQVLQDDMHGWSRDAEFQIRAAI